MTIVEQTVRVPEEKLGDLYKFVGELLSSGTKTGSADPIDQPDGGWTLGKVRNLWDRCGGERSRKFLRRVAQAAPVGIDADRLAAELGLDRGSQSIAGISGAIGHACSSMGMPSVPWGPNYEMSRSTAALVLQVGAGQ